MTDPRETGTLLDPRYNSDGLVTAVITDAEDGMVLMVGHMNAEALDLTRTTRRVHFYSRSRQRLWMKGEQSGHVLDVSEIRIDCDQDALWIRAIPAGPTCHTGQRSCFYRRVAPAGLEPV